MQLGDKIYLKIEKDGKTDEGEYVVIGISKQLSHCFGKDMYSNGFNSFEYGERQENRPDIVRVGSIYVPIPSHLDELTMKDLYYDRKIVTWEVIK